MICKNTKIRINANIKTIENKEKNPLKRDSISFSLSNFKILSLFFYKGKCKAIYIVKMFLFLFFNNVLSIKK